MSMDSMEHIGKVDFFHQSMSFSNFDSTEALLLAAEHGHSDVTKLHPWDPSPKQIWMDQDHEML